MMLFVEFFAVLYELQLKRHEARSERIHKRYERAFKDYYALHDKCTAVRAEYSTMPRAILGGNELASIDAAGGRQSKAFIKMKKRETAASKIDCAVSRARLRVKYAANARSVEQSHATAPASRVATAALQ
jgi:hypothetical protein